MRSADLTIRNGKVYSEHGFFEGGLSVKDGVIIAAGRESILPKGDEEVDAKGRLVLPGVVDIHAHLRDLERSSFEDFESGTKSAAAGGVTTVMEMPTTIPPSSTVEALKMKIAVASKKSVVDFALYAGAGTHNIDELKGLAEAGCIGYKTFLMIYRGREKDMRGVYIADDGSFYDVLSELCLIGRPLSVHAENGEMVEYFAAKVRRAGRKDLYAYLESKPGFVEGEAALRASYLAGHANTKLHIAHVSAKEVVDVLRGAQKTGWHQTGETCTHYLTFTIDDAAKLGPYGKVSPPIREKADQEALWQGILDGTLLAIGSDHAPFNREMKERGKDDVFEAQAGITGLQAMLPVMLTHVKKGRLSMEKLVQLLCTNAAKLFGIYPRKGTLQVGSDADIVILDHTTKEKLHVDEFYTKDRDAAIIYDGYEVYGKPQLTIVRGKIVAREGIVEAKPGWGKFIAP